MTHPSEYTAPKSILALFETDKAQRTSFATQIVQAIEEGEVDPLKIHVQVKAMEDIINSLTNASEKDNKNAPLAKRYRSLLLEAVEREGKKFTMHNAEFSTGEVGVKYDYSMCGDGELDALLREQVELKAAIDARQGFLKVVPVTGMEIVDKDTGEAITIYPPSKSSTTAVKVTLK